MRLATFTRSVGGWDGTFLRGFTAVTDDYFETVGTRLVIGRAFSPLDREGAAGHGRFECTLLTTDSSLSWRRGK